MVQRWEYEYAVHTKIDLWADIPFDYYGSYTKFDLVKRYEGIRDGDKWNIAGQEKAELPRRDMVWNSRDFGNYIENKWGSRSGLALALELDMLPFDSPGGIRLRGLYRSNRSFLNIPYSSSYIKQGVKSGALQPMSWNQFQRATKGQFTGKNHRRLAANAYFEYLNNYK
jgi:hypothetical protein